MITTRRPLFWVSLGLNAVLLSAMVLFVWRDVLSPRSATPSLYRAERLDYLRSLPAASDTIVFAGASLTHRGEWAEMLGLTGVRNRGVPGDTVRDLADRVDTLAGTNTRRVFLMVGLNDLMAGRPVAAIVEDYARLLGAIRAAAPSAVVVVQSVLPTNERMTGGIVVNGDVKRLNDELRRLAGLHHCDYLDVARALSDSEGRLDARYTLDGVHLNGAGYVAWANLVRKKLM